MASSTGEECMLHRRQDVFLFFSIRRLPMYQFLLSLTFSDILCLIGVGLTWTRIELYSTTTCKVSYALCSKENFTHFQLRNYLLNVGAWLSACSIVCYTYDRHLATTAYRHKRHLNCRRSILCVDYADLRGFPTNRCL